MKKSILIFCDNDISHNIPLIGIARVLTQKGYIVQFCGSSENKSFFKSKNIEYIVSEAFNTVKPAIKNNVDVGFFKPDLLYSIAQGSIDKLIQKSESSIILLPYYISYLFPFLKKKYDKIKFCCVNILLRGELFTPEYLYNFHYKNLDNSSKQKVDQIFGGTNSDTIIRNYYSNFKELILCPKELDISDKFIGQNVQYSEAIVGNPINYNKNIEKDNLIIFSMGSNSHLFPLVINSLVEKIVKCCIRLKEYDASFKIKVSVPNGILNSRVEDLCKLENLTLVNWFDQNMLLQKSKVMITHGGIGSVKECIYSLTPMLCFPLTRDQPYNSKRIDSLKLGKSMHPIDTSEKEIFDSIVELIESKEYHKNLKKFRTIFQEYKERETLHAQLLQIAG